MDLASTITLSRMDADMRTMDVIANNLANAGTPGFKGEHMQFTQWLSRQQGAGTAKGEATIALAQDRATWREQSAGALQHTGNPLDLAISGPGYFTVNTPRGPRLTRDGRFGLLPNGTVADANGNPLLDSTGQPIKVSLSDTVLTVAGDGTLSSQNGQLAKIGIVQPSNPYAVSAEGGTLFRADTPTSPVALPKLVQGAVEESNVQPVTEMTRMIDADRRFQVLTQFIQAESDRHTSVIDKLLAPQGA